MVERGERGPTGDHGQAGDIGPRGIEGREGPPGKSGLALSWLTRRAVLAYSLLFFGVFLAFVVMAVGFNTVTDRIGERVDVNAERLREQTRINMAVCEGQNEDRTIMRQILESSKRSPVNIDNPQAQARLDGLIALAPPKDCRVITNGAAPTRKVNE